MGERYRVSVERNTLRFAAAHMATFGGDCEPIHGHNYDVVVELEGTLTEDSWVVDFVEVKRLVKQLCDRLDHRFLLQTKSRALRLRETDSSWEVAFGDRLYALPKSDVVALPLDNSTAERLAEWLCQELVRELQAGGATNLSHVTVGVEEAPGQSGWFTQELEG